MKTLFPVFLLMSVYSFNAEAANIPVKEDTAANFLNTAYGNNAAQRMDIYLPAKRSISQTGCLILLHGGGWNSGSRHNLSAYVDSFKARLPGYAIFNIDYRLVSSSVNFTAQENDIKTAVNFIASHADAYNINTKKFVLIGVSAGAHLALLQAYKNTSPKVAAVIDFFGPTDLAEMYHHPWHAMIPHLMESFIGGTPETNTAYHDLSPVNYINKQTPPTLIFHGKQDYLVNVAQSQTLQRKLQQAGVVNKLVIYNSAGHGWYGSALSDSFDKIELFLKDI